MTDRTESTIAYLKELTEKDCELCPEMCLNRITYAITEIENLRDAIKEALSYDYDPEAMASSLEEVLNPKGQQP